MINISIILRALKEAQNLVGACNAAAIPKQDAIDRLSEVLFAEVLRDAQRSLGEVVCFKKRESGHECFECGQPVPPTQPKQAETPETDACLAVNMQLAWEPSEREAIYNLARSLERQRNDLRAQLAMAMDAAAKGDLARQTAGGMEMEIAELRALLLACQRAEEQRNEWKSAAHEWAKAAGEDRASLLAAEERIAVLSRICAESYQVVGALGDEAGRFPDDDALVKALDNLSDQAVTHEDVLPFQSFDHLEKAIARAESAEAKLARLPADWQKDSSLRTWFPITADILERTTRERDAIQAKLAIRDRDAERYRHIRPASFSRPLNVVDGDLNALNDEELDEAIDAAIDATREQKERSEGE